MQQTIKQSAKPLTAELVIKKAGGQTCVSRIFDISPQAVQDWIDRNCVPPGRVIALEKASGVSRHKIRPDIYPVE